mmetsp:Transcript_90104/g.241614  ORF Transcript_90104/g.241614 Transcript_90104/m.241614 type:complete len:201 (+) Transcript_90104:338-940(+)
MGCSFGLIVNPRIADALWCGARASIGWLDDSHWQRRQGSLSNWNGNCVAPSSQLVRFALAICIHGQDRGLPGDHPDFRPCMPPPAPYAVLHRHQIWLLTNRNLHGQILQKLHKRIVNVGEREVIGIPSERILQLHSNHVQTQIPHHHQKTEDRCKDVGVGKLVDCKWGDDDQPHHGERQDLRERQGEGHPRNLPRLIESI